MARTRRQDTTYDPLDRILAPPPDETYQQREAKTVSDAIDQQLEAERVAAKKGPRPVKVLLLGKSTTLKNFQLMYEPKAFRLERASWRAVIHLNVVRSFHHILDAITRSHKADNNPSLLDRKARLSKLFIIENILKSGETEATQRTSDSDRAQHQKGEIAVNSTRPWKQTITQLVHRTGPVDGNDDSDGIDWDNPEDPGRVLHELSGDMIKLWNDPITQRILEKQTIRLQDLAGFFLDQLERVTAPRYIPFGWYARLKTLGVTEHRFTLANPGSISRDWRVFDVGGHRSQVTAWIPYFDDMDSIIFLAPISCFDQTLAEDSKVNRLADSVTLWSEISTNPLLKSSNFILFLNKTDIFRRKLDAGVKLADYIVSYGKRPNNFESTTTYIRKKFADIQKDKSPVPRIFYCHLTTVTDPTSTRSILASLKEMLMRRNLAKTDLAL
ncbi:guanine nucleotide binding protein, alpha subunit [Ephemerocybe angulata]|uniref:Guanine nucleotide binding protein, alpha subunit n=1 Tax=Ephemerocybe angulata TaxID=980116 RepID=A0A8H6HVK8_9AGAR|nr:guanine nucleotide binding protein, alpha subunit [Tulosesus angulatus]